MLPPESYLVRVLRDVITAVPAALCPIPIFVIPMLRTTSFPTVVSAPASALHPPTLLLPVPRILAAAFAWRRRTDLFALTLRLVLRAIFGGPRSFLCAFGRTRVLLDGWPAALAFGARCWRSRMRRWCRRLRMFLPVLMFVTPLVTVFILLRPSRAETPSHQ